MKIFLKNLLLLIVSFSMIRNSYSQDNIVINGGFDDPYNWDSLSKGKPFFWSYLDDYKEDKLYWPHIYRPNSNIFFETPNTDAGYQMPYDGNSFSGIGTYDPEFEFRDYLVGHLSEKLIKNQQYKISFFLSLSNCSGFAVDHFGLSFSNPKELLNLSKKPWRTLPNELSPYYEIKGVLLTDTLNWIKVEGNIIANGGEELIIIGSFRKDAEIKVQRMNLGNCIGKDDTIFRSSYYFIDCVSVVKSQK